MSFPRTLIKLHPERMQGEIYWDVNKDGLIQTFTFTYAVERYAGAFKDPGAPKNHFGETMAYLLRGTGATVLRVSHCNGIPMFLL